MVRVNLTGFFWLTQRAIAEMLERGGGHVVNITITLADHANSSTPSVLTALSKRPRRGHQVTGDRVRLPRHPGQRRLTGHRPDAGEHPGNLRRARQAPPPRPCRPGQRHRRRHPLPGVITVHHRRDPAHRRRPDRWPLTKRPARGPPALSLYQPRRCYFQDQPALGHGTLSSSSVIRRSPGAPQKIRSCETSGIP